MSDATQILERVEKGDGKAAEELLPLVYEELRKLAAHKMAQEQQGHTLQPTALVHEAWLRLIGAANPDFQGRAHFFAAAAEAMRRILIENARRKARLKRGGEWERINLDELQLATESDPLTLLGVNEALEKLARHIEKLTDVVGLYLNPPQKASRAAIAWFCSPARANKTIRQRSTYLLRCALGRFPLFQLRLIARAERNGKTRLTHSDSIVMRSAIRKVI